MIVRGGRTRFTFKVRMADGRLVEVEQFAEVETEAREDVRAWVARNWPGARLEAQP